MNQNKTIFKGLIIFFTVLTCIVVNHPKTEAADLFSLLLGNLGTPSATVAGKVIDKNNTPIPDVEIKFIPDATIDLRFDVIMKDLELETFGKHDALNDAIMTAMIYLKLQNVAKL